jgi:hypothetical protein
VFLIIQVLILEQVAIFIFFFIIVHETVLFFFFFGFLFGDWVVDAEGNFIQMLFYLF